MVPGRLGSVQGHHHPERERVSAIQWLSGEERARSHGVGALGQSPRGEVTLRRDIQMGVLAHVVEVDVAGAGDLPPVAVGRLLRDPGSHGVPDPPNEAALLVPERPSFGYCSSGPGHVPQHSSCCQVRYFRLGVAFLHNVPCFRNAAVPHMLVAQQQYDDLPPFALQFVGYNTNVR